MPTPDTFRLLHFSDSHRGRQFREELWEHFVSKALTLRPHVILMTGDCVDTLALDTPRGEAGSRQTRARHQ